jgi:hypothetical protein
LVAKLIQQQGEFGTIAQEATADTAEAQAGRSCGWWERENDEWFVQSTAHFSIRHSPARRSLGEGGCFVIWRNQFQDACRQWTAHLLIISMRL